MRGEALWTIWSQSQWLGYSHVPHSKLIMIPLFDIVHGYLKFKPLPRSCNILYQGPVNCSPWPNSVNKVLLGHSHALSFAYHLWLPLYYDARTEQLFPKGLGPQSWNIICQTLYRANMSTWFFEMSPVPHSLTYSVLSLPSLFQAPYSFFSPQRSLDFLPQDLCTCHCLCLKLFPSWFWLSDIPSLFRSQMKCWFHDLHI